MQNQTPVIIVGGGLAGLSCARRLTEAGRPFLLLEQDAEFGGRVRTDYVEGFRLDRGFQVLQTAYPEAQSQLDYDALNLKSYLPGALIYRNAQLHRFMDPWRRPWDGMTSGLRSRIGSWWDLFRVAKLRARCQKGEIEELFTIPQQSTSNYLDEFGFSSEMIDAFFRPFFGGVFLERELATSNRMMLFVFRMFSTGDVAVPAEGMQAIPDQMVSRLPQESLRPSCRVEVVSESGVQLQGGDFWEASQVILATPAHITSRFLNSTAPDRSQRVACFYYSAPIAPVEEPILVLNGEESGPINNLSVPSIVSPSYAPSGRHLVSVTVVDQSFMEQQDLESKVRKQCAAWFGDQVDDWGLLKSYDIPHALPDQTIDAKIGTGRTEVKNGLIICGDHLGHGSIQSALVSGRKAAELSLSK